VGRLRVALPVSPVDHDSNPHPVHDMPRRLDQQLAVILLHAPVTVWPYDVSSELKLGDAGTCEKAE
jgi:hypothetical protein